MGSSIFSVMNHTIDHDELAAALRRCGSSWTSAQTHGLLCGRLAMLGAIGAAAWRDQVLEDLDPNDASRVECESVLDTVLQSTWRQLAERQSEFDLLLPDEDEDAALRTQAIADWCEGFLHGLVAHKHSDTVKRRLSAEPLSDVIKDMLEITRATVGDDEDEEDNELAYIELVEYVRVATQLAYEELADLRDDASSAAPVDEPRDTLH